MNDDLFTISLPTPDHSRMLFNGVSSFMITSNPHDQLMSTNPYPSAIQEEIGNPFPDIYSGNVDMGTPLPATSIPKPFGQSLFNFNSSLAINSCGTGHDEFLQVMSTVHPSYHVSESTFPGWNVNNTNCPLPRNELSLSLGSCSEKSCSVVTQVTSKDAEELSLYGLSSSVHFPRVLGSRYFHLSEEILAEVVNYALGNCDEMDFDKGSSVVRSDEFASSYGEITAQEEIENQVLKEKNAQKIELLTLLQTVNHRFNQYLDRIQNAVAIFHDATNSTGPQRLAQFALNTLSSTYRNLRERIISQILLSGQENNRECMRGKAKAFESSFIQKQWALQELGRKDQQSWRPQRGLPERSVSVLRAWMFQNFLHPYPKDNDKHLLALQSGLTRNQVSNWFINARVRLWKPMIEEMYSEIKKHQTEEGTEGDFRSQGNIGNQRP